VLLSVNLESIVHGLERLLGTQFMDASVYLMSDLPARVEPRDVLLIAGPRSRSVVFRRSIPRGARQRPIPRGPCGMTDEPILACDDVHKHFIEAGNRLDVLKGVNLRVLKGETLASSARPGPARPRCCRSRRLDLPSAGKVRLLGTEYSSLSDAARGDLRNRPRVRLPVPPPAARVQRPGKRRDALLVRRTPVTEAKAQARHFLERVGLGERLTHRPHSCRG